MSLLLIRHGETALNAARVLQPADTTLSARGIVQAQALARRLVMPPSLRITAIISSDLPRARRTAEAIAAATGAPIETSALLQERNFGDWRGLPYDGMPIDPLTLAGAPPGGESAAAFEARVAQAFALVVQRHAALGGPLAVVTHGLVLIAMTCAHLRLTAGMTVPTHFGNTSLSIVDAMPPHAVTLLNDTAHLDTTARDDPAALSGG